MSEQVTQVQPTEQPRQSVPSIAEGHQEASRDWKEFSQRTRVKADSGAQPQEHADLTKAAPEQRAEWNETGSVRPEEKLEAKPAAKAEEQAKPEEPTKAAELPPWDRAYENFLEKASKRADFNEMVGNWWKPIFPNSPDGHARLTALATAVQQVPNREDLLFFLAMPENAEVLKNMNTCDDPAKIGQAVHQISAALRFGVSPMKREVPRPRAPKPPSEVGGRAAPMGDAEAEAIRTNDFRAAESIWLERARRERQR